MCRQPRGGYFVPPWLQNRDGTCGLNHFRPVICATSKCVRSRPCLERRRSCPSSRRTEGCSVCDGAEPGCRRHEAGLACPGGPPCTVLAARCSGWTQLLQPSAAPKVLRTDTGSARSGPRAAASPTAAAGVSSLWLGHARSPGITFTGISGAMGLKPCGSNQTAVLDVCPCCWACLSLQHRSTGRQNWQ